MVEEGALPHPRKWHSRKLWLVAEVEAYLNDWPSDEEETHFVDLGRSVPSPDLGNGYGGYPIIRDPEHPLKKYYDKLGFDPATMGEADMRRLMDQAEQQWLQSIPDKPIGKREQRALEQLANYGIGTPVHWSKVKNCGADTEARLKARGYIESRPHPKHPNQTEHFVLTKAGMDAWERLQSTGYL